MPKPDPNELLQEIKTIRTEAKRSRTALNQYEKTASTKVGRLNKLVATSKEKVDTLVVDLKERFGTESKTLKASAKTETEAIEKIRKEAKDHLNRFNQTYNAATHKQGGVMARHEQITSMSKDAGNSVKAINKDLTKARNETKKISEHLKSAQSNDKEIEDIYHQALAVNQEVQNTYGITLDATMAGTFKERRDALANRTSFWEWAYISSIASIVVAIVCVLTIGKPEGFSSVLTDRVVFITPLVLVAFVFSRQFSHERRLYEEYAFKTATAQALRGYTLLLNSQYQNDSQAQQKILRFTLDAMSGIFNRDPLAQNPTVYHFAFGNGLGKFEAKLEEVVKKVAKESAEEVIGSTQSMQ